MKTKLFFTFAVFIFFLSFIISTSCHRVSTTPEESSEKNIEKLLLTLNLNNAPAEVYSISGILERTGYSSIQRIFTISGDSAYADFGQVVVGTWHLSVSAFDSSNQEIYHGETDVTIQAGQINTIMLTLNPVTGGLVVIVNWGTPTTGDYIYTYNFRDPPRNVYRFNLQTSLLEQLTNEDMSEFPVYLSNIDKIGYQRPYIHQFWIMDKNGSNKQFLFQQSFDMEMPDFAPGNQRLCFYLIEGGGRRLGLMNFDGTEFEYLTPYSSLNNAIPDINDAGDRILYQSDLTGNYNIFMMNLQNNTTEQLTFNSYKSTYPQWSSNNNGFYYLMETTDSVQIIYQNLNSNSAETIISLADPYIIDFTFSPDEQKICLLCSPNFGNYEPRNIYIYDLNTNQISQKTFTNFLFDRPKWYQF